MLAGLLLNLPLPFSGHSRASRGVKPYEITPLPDGVRYPDPTFRQVSGVRYFAPTIYEIDAEQKRIRALEATKKIARKAKTENIVKQRKALTLIRGRLRNVIEVEGELTGIASAIRAGAIAKRALTVPNERSEFKPKEREVAVAFEQFITQTEREIAAARERIEYQKEIERQYKAKRKLWLNNQNALAILLLM